MRRLLVRLKNGPEAEQRRRHGRAGGRPRAKGAQVYLSRWHRVWFRRGVATAAARCRTRAERLTRHPVQWQAGLSHHPSMSGLG